jgi:ABC-type multidrug transport system ATPase subunit
MLAFPSFTILLDAVGKRYNREWIFKKFDYKIESGKAYAIVGGNGSGKSTLLQTIAGSILHSTGTITYQTEGKNIEDAYKYISIATPYMELIEEMTAKEFLHFHASFTKLILSNGEILAAVQLQGAADKQIRYFSSGMKQRLKLAQAFFSDTPVLLLDEPTTNLDEQGVQCYEQLIQDYTKSRLVIVGSNVEREYKFCTELINMADYKN